MTGLRPAPVKLPGPYSDGTEGRDEEGFALGFWTGVSTAKAKMQPLSIPCHNAPKGSGTNVAALKVSMTRVYLNSPTPTAGWDPSTDNGCPLLWAPDVAKLAQLSPSYRPPPLISVPSLIPLPSVFILYAQYSWPYAP